MTVYQFSALSDGQAISFNPNSDVLNFDQTAIAAAAVRATADGANLRVSASGKDVFLLGTAPAQVATTNVTFANGSHLLFGDNTPAQTADNGANALNGLSGHDHLWGFGGNDTLSGGTGDDWLAGGTGQDNINGGAGADSVVFREAAGNSNFDRVSGFVSGSDRLMFHEDVFSGVDSAGAFRAGAGVTSGQDADDRIIYNTSNGFLYYDADGSGAGRSQLVAILQGTPTLAAGDIDSFDDSTSGGGGGGATEGDDTLVGTPGDDSIDGLGGDDSILGLDGNDTLVGGEGGDTLEGGAGDDIYHAEHDDLLIDSSGIDTVIAPGDWTLDDGFENLTLTGPSIFPDGMVFGTGNALDNLIIAQTNAFLIGLGGNDTLIGSNNQDFFIFDTQHGADSVDGGDGQDWLTYQATDVDVTIDFRDSTAISALGSVSFINVENALGGSGDDRFTADDLGRGLLGYHGDDTLTGGAGDDFLNGGGVGWDQFGGSGGNDLLMGLDGDDDLHGEAGADTLNGGAGNDLLVGEGEGADSSTDVFVFDQTAGAAHADVVSDFSASGVRDELHLHGGAMSNLGLTGRFAAGDARFFAGPGANSGQDSTDRVIYNTSTGELWYDADGNLAGTAELIATLQGAPGLAATDIVVVGGPGAGPINGTEGDDSITGTSGDDTINGFGGDDDLMGEGGNDVLSGGSGNDFLLGGEGTDSMSGGEGNDSLAGNADMPWTTNDSADTLDGGLGNDVYYVRGGAEVLADAGGTDTVVTNVDWTLGAGFENMRLDGAGLVVYGNELANQFENFPYWTDDTALPPASTIFAGAGNDTFTGAWGGATTIFHGEGGDDVVLGDARGSTFTGGAGRDNLNGGAGDDWLEGGTGQDSLTGGDGADSFVFRESPTNSNFDRLLDFTSGADTLRFDDAAYTNIGALGDFAAGDDRFFAGAGARSGVDAEDRLIYNTSTGTLWYDADGSGAGGQLFVATLQGAPALVASDIAII